MICTDCVDAADTNRRRGRADHPGHDACRTRNTDREPGQLADCTCQHQPTPATGARARS